MNSSAVSEILNVANGEESGGGHGQKGVDFQRYWAIHRMIQLESLGVNDFLILIEALQDVAEIDSCDTPTSICLYQVKKKDRGEWSWNKLTNLYKPPRTQKPDASIKFQDSPIGKLYATFIAFSNLTVRGRFISNQGCDLPLANGDNVSTSLPSPLEYLPDTYKDVIREQMASLGTSDQVEDAIQNIYFEKVSIPPDDPKTHVIGQAHQFIEGRSPTHAGQARSFVDALMAIIGPLGAKTDTCHDFEQLCELHGFSREQFLKALSDLEEVPDLLTYIDDWLAALQQEGMGVMDITGIRSQITSIYRYHILISNDEYSDLVRDCDNFLDQNMITDQIRPILELGYGHLKKQHGNCGKYKIMAQLILRAINKCVDQT